MPAAGVQLGTPSERFSIALRSTSASPRLRSDRTRCADEWPLRAVSGPSITVHYALAEHARFAQEETYNSSASPPLIRPRVRTQASTIESLLPVRLAKNSEQSWRLPLSQPDRNAAQRDWE
jgi:hypothetical protein